MPTYRQKLKSAKPVFTNEAERDLQACFHLTDWAVFEASATDLKILIQNPYDQHWQPQGCVLSPLLFSLYTNNCTSKDPFVKLLKFVDGTTVISLSQKTVTSLLTYKRLKS